MVSNKNVMCIIYLSNFQNLVIQLISEYGLHIILKKN